jgi:hypothetical protein
MRPLCIAKAANDCVRLLLLLLLLLVVVVSLLVVLVSPNVEEEADKE